MYNTSRIFSDSWAFLGRWDIAAERLVGCDVWPLVALGDIFNIARGGSPRPILDYVTDSPDGVNWIMISDASEGSKYITKTKKRIKPSGVKRSRMVHPGDFLLSNSMSFGHPYILKTSGCIHDGWLVLSAKKKNISQDYFYYLLRSPLMFLTFKGLAGGSTVKNLNIELVTGVKVTLPTLDEQKGYGTAPEAIPSQRLLQKSPVRAGGVTHRAHPRD
ncbi:MAG TPA: restriction endonuclease subunit S [Candidatus Limnocylindrales bacterium]|nr:restriction endonuclease subunit S [Candidatus Limnocylindrales bacterium]